MGDRMCVGVKGGTAGLDLDLLALGIGAGDELGFPWLTFAGSGKAVRLVGAEPVSWTSTRPRSAWIPMPLRLPWGRGRRRSWQCTCTATRPRWTAWPRLPSVTGWRWWTTPPRPEARGFGGSLWGVR